jgi:hypothetical protein
LGKKDIRYQRSEIRKQGGTGRVAVNAGNGDDEVGKKSERVKEFSPRRKAKNYAEDTESTEFTEKRSPSQRRKRKLKQVGQVGRKKL